MVWLQPLDENGEDCGEPVHFGRVCGARAAGWGYGSDRGRIDRRIRDEEKKARKHYETRAAQALRALVDSGAVVLARVAFGFDLKSGTHNYGYIYTLPGDPIAAIADPVYQQAEIKAAKGRLRERFPIFRTVDERLPIAELRAMLA